jgi:hypothetical protein
MVSPFAGFGKDSLGLLFVPDNPKECQARLAERLCLT